MPRNNRAGGGAPAALAACAALLLAACGGGAAGAPDDIGAPARAERQGEFSLLWRRNVGAMPPYARAVKNGGRICTVAADGKVSYADAAGEAALESLYVSAAGGIAAAACDGSVIAVVSDAGALAVYDAQGKALWRDNLRARVLAPPLLTRGRLIALDVKGRASAYAARRGARLWRHSSELKNILYTPVASMPAVFGGRVYAGLSSGNINALNFADGRLLWETAIADSRGINPVANIANVTTPAEKGGHVCAAAYQGGVGCFAAADGAPVWRHELSARLPAAFDLDGARLFVADDAQHLHAFDARGGERLWRRAMASAATAAPLFIRGALVVGGADGFVRAHLPDGGELAGEIALHGGGVLHLLADGDDIIALTANGALARLRFAF